MPSGVFYVFKKYLHFCRMSWDSISQSMEEAYNARDYKDEPGLYSAYLTSSDYFDLFTYNLFVPMVATVIISFIWICVALVDCF